MRWDSQDFDELSITKAFQSLISQELTGTDDIAKNIQRLSESNQKENLMNLFLSDSVLSMDVLRSLFRSCIGLRKGGSEPKRVFDTVFVVDREANIGCEGSWIKFMEEMMRGPAMGQVSFVSIGRKSESTGMLWRKCLLDAHSGSRGKFWSSLDCPASTGLKSFQIADPRYSSPHSHFDVIKW